MAPIVIIGTGLAGYTLARELRKLDTTTPLLMITSDDGSFYSKPMLSNALLRKKTPAQLANANAEKMAADLNAEILVQTRAESIDTTAHTVTVPGRTIEYSCLVLAVGAHPIRLPMEGDGAADVLTINSLADYTVYHDKLQQARSLAIIGPGLIGSEFANDHATAGYKVDVIGPDPHPLGRLLPAEAGEAVRAALADIGVSWHLGTTVSRIDRLEHGYRLSLANGESIDADLVLSAIGLQASTQLAKDAGLATGRGIIADHQLRTSNPDVYTLGDCAEVDGMVLPFVLPLMEQARTLAAILAGQSATLNYPPMPVVVKTTSHPVVVAPPPAGAAGEWHVEISPTGVQAEFSSGQQLLGFALTGEAVSAKQALTKLLPS